MNYLLVNYEYPPVGAGAATATKAIAHALGRAGHEVLVLTGSYPGEPRRSKSANVEVYRVSCRRARLDRSNVVEMLSFLRAGLFALPKLLREHRIDGALIFFSFPCGPIGLLARVLRNIPYVIALRGGDVPGTESSLALVHRVLKPFRRLILRRSAAVVANSSGLRDLSLAADPVPVGVIPNGVDTDFFSPADQVENASSDRFRVLFVGRFHAQKNLPLLLDQFARLVKESEKPVELHLVGDGPLLPVLKEHAAKLKLTDKIKWHGWLPRAALRDVYQSADCFINPSLYEGMPNVVLEAMACALPVIASNVPGNDALVVPAQTGHLFELHQPDALAKAIKQLMDDPVRSAQLGANGRARVVAEFSWRRVAEEYLNLLRE